MSKYQTVRAIKQEIKRLNREIDLRIIKGLSYRDLSRRHKFLMSELNNIQHGSWFASFRFVLPIF